MINVISIIIGKFILFLLKLLGKKGGNFPGIVLLKLNKNFFKKIKINAKVIVITGTNGKTWTTNLIYNTLLNSNKKVISNTQGNNINYGIATLFVKNIKLNGTLNYDYIVIEVDEHYLPVVFKDIKVDSLIILNLFRDQLDRSGEVETLINKMGNFIKTYNGNLILNSDDPNVSRFSLFNKDNKNIYYFSVEKFSNSKKKMDDKGEGLFCPNCFKKLKYDYYQYSHIGKFKCPVCNYGYNKIDTLVENIDFKNKTFYLGKNKYKTMYNNMYSMYNISAALTLFKIYNIKNNVIEKSISNFEINNGRLEKFIINDCISLLNLAKNPTGVTVTLKVMNENESAKELLFVLNDNDADGHDVSWIYDINFNVLNNVKRVVTSGKRAYDIAVRIKMSGYNYKNIVVKPDISDAINTLYETKNDKYIITNYTALIPTRNKLIEYKRKKDYDDV